MSVPFGSYPFDAAGVDSFVHPQIINADRVPTTLDLYPQGTFWCNNAVSPKVIYQTTGAGNWSATNTSGSFTNLTAAGTVNLNASGAGTTTIGTGGTGAVNIGNATGGTAVTGPLSVTGDITTSAGNVVISGAAKQLQVEGGAVTDFIGTGTLTSGTVTIANTNIAAGDRIFIQRTAANASTTLGELSYTISAGASFTVTSLILGTPASPQTADVSSFAYFIVRQL